MIMASENIQQVTRKDIEHQLLACILHDPERNVINDCVSGGIESSMFDGASLRVWDAMIELWNDDEEIDTATVGIKSGLSFIDIIDIENVRDGCVGHKMFIDELLKWDTRHRLDRISMYIQDNASSDPDDTVCQVLRMAEDRPVVKVEENSAGVICKGFVERIRALEKEGASITTNLPSLNHLMPIRNGQLLTLAARPGFGKTALACQLAFYSAVVQNKSVAFFSMEMSRDELMMRGLSMMSETSGGLIKEGIPSPQTDAKVNDALNRIAASDIHLYDNASLTTDRISSICKKLKSKGGLDFVVVDYLQLITPSDKKANREQQVGGIARDLKKLAMNLRIPVLALSQLNRDVVKTNRKPNLSDLRESGSIEQDSDIVMFIHPIDPNANDDCEIIVEKHRNGSIGSITTEFMKARSYFKQK